MKYNRYFLLWQEKLEKSYRKLIFANCKNKLNTYHNIS
ncbi:hypothetical protein AT236_00098 [Lactobacillus delbrueckii subsp. bulgaricus]|nr:hypothetical protein AT236_00098 [Lactobacillus delbrueckii subsp. bulgaricus]